MDYIDLATNPKRVIKLENGYYMIHAPGHPRASDSGYVFEHIYIYEKTAGFFLDKGIHVHHLDSNPGNNNPSNLVALYHRDHVKIHSWLHTIDPANHAPYAIPHRSEVRRCAECSVTITNGNAQFCSTECGESNKSKNSFPAEELFDQVAEHGFEATGRIHGVSGNAIKKRLRNAGYDVKELSASRVFKRYTKTCSAEGCDGVVHIRMPSDEVRRKYCSVACATKTNQENGAANNLLRWCRG